VTRRFSRLALAAAFVAAAIAHSAPSHAAGHAVEIRNNTFTPPELTVAVGDTVVWHNFDAENHSVVGGAINSPDIAPGGEFSWTFSSPGDLSYTCRFHPYMSGVVHASSSAAPAPASAAPPAPSGGGAATPSPTTTMPATPATSPPPAAYMALASETAIEPELFDTATTTTAPTIAPTTVTSAVTRAAIDLAGDSDDFPVGLVLAVLLALAAAAFFGVRALRKDLKS
jgi:plastocyanin